MTMVHPFDDLEIIAGQGTIGLELFEDYPEMDTVIVPLSGGGLMSGIAFTVKSILPSIHVVCVSMERGPSMVESLKAGRVVDIVEEPTLADALAGGLNKDNKYTFPMVQQYVDETVLVSEEEITQALWLCLSQQRMVIEGGAAVGIAALLADKVQKYGENIAVVLSGANVSMQVMKEIINKGAMAK
jgi:threonine dehydratase